MNHLTALLARRPELAPCERDIKSAMDMIISCYRRGGKLLLCGNGGSASDCEHIVGELMKSFLLKRPLPSELTSKLRQTAEHAGYLIDNLQMGLPAISLPSQIGINTAFANDVASDLCFAQQVVGYGKQGDILIGISTSGGSKNVVYAFETARALGLNTIAFTGQGGRLTGISDVSIQAPSTLTFEVQEFHLMIYHCICKSVEQYFFGE